MNSDKHNKPSLISRIVGWADRPSTLPAGPKQALHTFVRIFLITAREFNRNELSLRASALTFTILLSLVPMLAMSTALVKGFGGNNQLRQMVSSYIDALEQSPPATAPAPSPLDVEAVAEPAITAEIAATLTVHLRSAADRIFDYVDQTDFTTLGSISVLVMLIAIILVFNTIEQAMNRIWKVPAGRSALRKVTDYLALLILMPVAVNISFAATTVLRNPTLLATLEPFLPVLWLQSFVLLLLPVFFITLALAISYMVFPNTRVKTTPSFIGATLAASLWFITQNVYISLQIGVSNYNAIYGSFATLPLFLIWLYLGWIFILSGAQLAFVCQTHNNYQLIPTTPRPAEQLSAAFDIIHQVFVSFDQQQPLTVKMLPALCPEQRPFLLLSTLDQLLEADILHLNDNKQCLFPALPAIKLKQAAVVKTILGTDTPATEGGRLSRLAIEAAIQALPPTFEENQNR